MARTIAKHGGLRPGAGRKAPDSLGPVKRKTTTLDDATVTTMQANGDGDLSRGIRRAARTIEKRRK